MNPLDRVYVHPEDAPVFSMDYRVVIDGEPYENVHDCEQATGIKYNALKTWVLKGMFPTNGKYKVHEVIYNGEKLQPYEIPENELILATQSRKPKDVIINGKHYTGYKAYFDEHKLNRYGGQVFISMIVTGKRKLYRGNTHKIETLEVDGVRYEAVEAPAPKYTFARKQVIINGITFPSMSHAAKHFKCSDDHLRDKLNGKSKLLANNKFGIATIERGDTIVIAGN